ncbi:MAG: MG2 domain-containing protein [Flavobacteriales bacterium]
MRTRPLLFALAALLFVSACHKKEALQRPGGEFVPYVTAFTAGHISARAKVLVRLHEGLALKDTSEAALQQLFQLDPRTEGSVRWEDAHTLAFQPRERLLQATNYNVTFRLGKLADVPANLQELRFGFATYEQNIDLRISDLQSLDPTDLSWQRVVVSVFTSDDATGLDLAKCVSATQDGHTLKMHWEHEPGGTLHRAVADSVKRGEQASAVEFHWDGKPIGGSGSGARTFTIPALGDIQLVASETSTTDEEYATLLFSDPLDPTQDLSGLAGISGVDDCRLAIVGNKLLIYPGQRLIGEQSAFVAAGLKNVNGRAIGKDITVDLFFEEVKPDVRAVGSGTILPSTDGLLFPFEAVNLNAVDVQIIRIYADNVPQFLQVNELSGERELARVARPVVRRTVPLDGKEMAKPGEWTRYYLDLDKLLRTEPGAIYRVIIGFRQAYSTYPCGEAPKTVLPQTAPEETPDDDAQWDQSNSYYYYDDYDDEGEYNYEEREDPCSASYFRGKNNVVQRNILASDLGLIAKRGNDGSMLLAVSDLRTTAPVSGVKLQVLDLQRRTIAEPVTDNNGMAVLPPSDRKSFLIVASKGDQRGYLKTDDGSALSVSEFDVQGESVDKGLKGFLYGERGVWRPGDSLYLTFMLQQPRIPLPKDIPVTFELSDPQGRLAQRFVRTSGTDGVYAFRCATPPDAPTGIWNARVSVGGTSFHRSIRIETVKPNRIKILLDLGGERLSSASKKNVQLQANWLHGAPASKLAAKVTVSLTRASADFKGYGDYAFDDLSNDLNAEESTVYDGRLDVNGHASFPFDLELNERSPAAVKANVVTRVFEAGGDASMDRTDVTYYPYTAYAGVKIPVTDNYWGSYFTDTTYALGAVSLDSEGKALPNHALDVQVVKVSYDWWWNGDMDGPSNYLNAPSSRVISEQHITTDAKGKANFNFRVDRPLWGRFIVRVSDPTSGHVSAAQLYVDWPGYGGRSRRESSKDAAMLRFNSDKEKYAVGDECAITFPSSGKGRALVSIENGSRILSAQWVELKEKETVFRFPVTAEMAPNAFAHITLIQPHALTAPKEDGTANDLPIRMYGVIPIPVENAATHLTPVIAAPPAIKTDESFSVSVSEKDGKAMTYTLAIVDEGLLDLTRFKTPDPWNYFYAKEALGVRTWDVYDQVIGAFGQQLRRILALGGSDQASPAQATKAQRFKPVVHFVGPFKLEKGKKATHQFTISNYVGSVRIMVVAGTPQAAYGSAEKAVPVRKPLMLLATLPRVTGPGETVDLPVTVFAMEAKVKNVQLALEANDLFTVLGPTTQALTFPATGEQTVVFRVKMNNRIGIGKVMLTATGAGEKATQSIEVDVRQAGSPETEATEMVLEAGQRWEGSPEALGVGGTNSAYLELSTLPPLDLGRRLQFLIDYPHGCLEQTTSKAFPQLFLADVMEMNDATVAEMRANVEAALRKYSQFQTGSGGFAYWPGQREVDEWTSAYAGHFMIEAERKGFALMPGLKDKWLAYTRRQARDWAPENSGGWHMDRSSLTQAYRLYTLALANQAESGSMNRLRTTPGIGLQAKWMLAAAYALNNRNDVAQEIAKGLTTSIPSYVEMGWTYGSDLRDEAIIAEALMRMGDKAGAAGVVKNIGTRLASGNWYSTQSTAWALLAVSRVVGGTTPDRAMHFSTSLNGAKAQERMSERPIVRMDLPVPDGKKKVNVVNTGKNLLYVRLVRTGVPPPGEEHPASNGLAMSVKYTTMEGGVVDPANLGQGTDFIAMVTVGNPGMRGTLQQLALTQVFPSGWEIRNSRLEGTENVQMNSPFTYQDIRDDRVLTYFDLGPGESRTWSVLLNAAYTGRFHLPSTTCSAMYDNTINARNGGQWVTVSKPGEATSSK